PDRVTAAVYKGNKDDSVHGTEAGVDEIKEYYQLQIITGSNIGDTTLITRQKMNPSYKRIRFKVVRRQVKSKKGLKVLVCDNDGFCTRLYVSNIIKLYVSDTFVILFGCSSASGYGFVCISILFVSKITKVSILFPPHMMTTSVVNNSVFRGFFEKQKLTSPNFIDWYIQLRIVLSAEDKLNYLERLIPAAPVPAQVSQQAALEALAAHAAWVKGSKKIELKTLFAQQAEQELLQTMPEFHSCKQEEGQSVSSYVLKMKSYIDNLECLGHLVTTGLRVNLILISLRKEFDGFVHNYNMHIMRETINELHAMLKLHEQTLPKNNAPVLHAIRAGKVQKRNKKHKPQPQLAARGQNQRNGKISSIMLPRPRFLLHQRGKILLRTQSVINTGIQAIGRGTVLSI
nr:hypothetical protein [Tanacetum cinerariifolium]